MKKVLKIIGIFTIIIAILIVLASIWVKGLREDQKKTKKIIKTIKESYTEFNNRVEEFSQLRNELYEYKEDLYLETLAQKADDWNTFIKMYSESIEYVEKASKNLKENCKIKYGDVDANSKCTAFSANYEAAMNYYIADAEDYNNLIDEYDKWNKEENLKHPNIEKAKFPVYKKYIDFDKDGEYFGKEEVKENE